MSDKIKTGNIGESLAAEFLAKQGYEIVARNFRAGKGELDLIVKRDDWVLFVEVKTRASTEYGEPEDFVTVKQMNMIYQTAEEWIYATDWQGQIRFDIITVKINEDETDGVIEHFQDAIS